MDMDYPSDNPGTHDCDFDRLEMLTRQCYDVGEDRFPIVPVVNVLLIEQHGPSAYRRELG